MNQEKSYKEILEMMANACRGAFCGFGEELQKTVIECATQIYISQKKGKDDLKICINEENVITEGVRYDEIHCDISEEKVDIEQNRKNALFRTWWAYIPSMIISLIAIVISVVKG